MTTLTNKRVLGESAIELATSPSAISNAVVFDAFVLFLQDNKVCVPLSLTLEASVALAGGMELQAFDQHEFELVCASVAEFLSSVADGEDVTIKKLEVLATFVLQLSMSDSLCGVTLAVTALANSLFQGSITVVVKDLLAKFFEAVQPESMVEQSLTEYFDTLRGQFDFVSALKDVPLMQKLHKFLLYVMSASLLDGMGLTLESLGYATFEAEQVRKVHSSKLGFWHSFFDALILFCQSLTRAVETGSMMPFSASGATYDVWVSRVFKLKRQSKHLANPAPHGFNIYQFRQELDDCLSLGKTVVQTLSCATKMEKEKLRALLNDLELIKADLITRRSTQIEREAPFSILLAGGSSVGKSHLTNIMHHYFAQLFDLPGGSEFKYTRNFTEEFWNGFSTSQWFIVMDDIAAQNPNLGTMDPSLSELINVVNNVSFVPNQADLCDKGKTPCLAKLVIGTTNTPELNAQYYFTCPLAIQRRLPYVIDVRPKKEFSKSNFSMLDPSRCVSVEGKFDNYWTLFLSRVEPSLHGTHRGRATLIPVCEFHEIGDFLEWFGKTAKDHFNQQANLGAAEVAMRTIEVCGNCFRASYECNCVAQVLNESVALVRSQTQPGWGWRADDTESLWYTLYSYCVLIFFIWPFAGIYFPFNMCLWWTGAPAFVTQLCSSLALEERFFQFLLRRITRRVRWEYRGFFRYIRLFTLAAGAWGVVSVASNFLSRSFNAQVLKAQKQVEEQNRKLLAQCERYRAYVAEHGGEPWLSKDDFEAQVEISNVGKPPEQDFVSRENVWYAESFSVTALDVEPKSLSWKGLPRPDVEIILLRNIVRFRFSEDGVAWKNTGGLALGGHLFVCNNHAVPHSDTLVTQLNFAQDVGGLGRNVEFVLVRTQIFRVPECDLAFLAFHNVPPFRSIRGIVSRETFDGKYLGAYLSLDRETLLPLRNELKDIAPTVHSWEGETLKTWRASSRVRTEVGDCGSVMLVFSPLGPVILGIHALGNLFQNVVVAPLTVTTLARADAHFGAFIVQGGVPSLEVPGVEVPKLGPLHSKSPFRWLERGCAIVHGSFQGFRPAPKSRVERTLIAPMCERRGYSQKFGPPVMQGWKPWRKALLPMTQIPTSFRQDILDHCVETYVDDVLRGLPSGVLERVHVLDLHTAINGMAGVAYIDKMKRDTSAGFPWCRSKKGFLTSIGVVGDLHDCVDVDSVCKERIALYIDKYREGERCCPVFMGHLKDEPTKFSKIADSKTRVFLGGPMDWSLLVRMYTLSIVKLIQENRFAFESAPGTIAQSPEWGEIRNYVVSFGEDRIVAGDYGNFDKSMPAQFIQAAFRIIIDICDAAGWPEQDLQVVAGIGVDIAYPLCNMNGDLTTFYGSNPSGHPLTVIVNCLANCLYMRYVYAVVSPKHSCLDFQSKVHLMVYGDDNIMGVCESAPWFNHSSIQKVLAAHGVIYTMPDKTAESVPYTHIDGVTFLKRHWRWDEEVEAFLCPLEHESIEKSLITCVVSKSVSPEYQCLAIVSAAVQEYFHYGRRVFEQRRSLLQEVVQECGIIDLADDSVFPTWEQLNERFHGYGIVPSWKEREVFRVMSFPLKKNRVERYDSSLFELESFKTLNELSSSEGGDGFASPPSLISLASKTSNEEAGCGTCQSCGKVLELSQGEGLFPSISSGPDMLKWGFNEVPSVTSTCSCFRFQSATETGTSEVSTVVVETEENVAFLESPIPSVGFSGTGDPVGTLESNELMGLREFLSRPVQIANFVWNEADAVGVTHAYAVWADFFNQPVIKRKLENFAFVRCDLHIKIMLNSSPFYFGAMLAHYLVLPNFKPSTIIVDPSMAHTTLSSQRPHVWLYPQDNAGGEMVLPFINPLNWIPTGLMSEFSNMGTLIFENITTLESATSVVGMGVPVTIYAWATNVSLMGPSIGLTLQSKDEYGQGPVSKHASAVACAMGMLKDVPIIGPFATATQVGASVVSSVARALGFTNTPVIEDTRPVKPSAVPVFASSEQGFALDKLTLDSKNEVSIDPGVVGLPSGDPLQVSSIVGREAYLTTCSWSTADAVDTLLFQTAVTPDLSTGIVSGASRRIYYPPCGWVSHLFGTWRGDMIFRFRFVCSQYHRGRVRAIFDPSGDAVSNISNQTGSQPACFNEIIDLTKDTSVEIRVPYMQAQGWLTNFGVPTPYFQANGAAVFFHVPGRTNGTLVLRVLNSLTAPVVLSTISVIVSVRGADNLEFASPKDINPLFSVFAPQSADEYDDKPTTMVIAGTGVGSSHPGRFLIHMGEVVQTLRQLIHRTSTSCFWTFLGVAGTYSSNYRIFHRMPRWPGYDPLGRDTAIGLTVPGPWPYEFVSVHPLTWIAEAFVGYRGSVNWTLLPYFNAGNSIYKLGRSTVAPVEGVASELVASAGRLRYMLGVTGRGYLANAAGCALTHINTNAGLTIASGFYSQYKFNSANGKLYGGVLPDGSSGQTLQATAVSSQGTQAALFSMSAGASVDWSPCFFLNVPTLYLYNSQPVPP